MEEEDRDDDDEEEEDDEDAEEENQRRYDFRQRKTVVRYQAPLDGMIFICCQQILVIDWL